MAKKPRKPKAEAMYTTLDAARVIGVSPRTVQLWADAGILQVRKTPGGHRRIPASVLEAFMKELDQTPGGEVNVGEKSLTVLIAEDEADIRKLYQINLATSDLPLKLIMAKDGHEALIRLGEHRPDVLIVDLNMPRMDGFHMIRSLKNDPNYKDLDIIVVSALSEESIANRGGLPTGVINYGKPIPFEKLEDHLKHRLATLGPKAGPT